MANRAVQNMTVAGGSESFVACDVAGDSFVNDGRTYLHFKNTNAAARNVTIDSVAPCSYGFDHNVTAIVPATTGDIILGPFQPDRFGGTVNIAYDAVTNLSVAVVRMP